MVLGIGIVHVYMQLLFVGNLDMIVVSQIECFISWYNTFLNIIMQDIDHILTPVLEDHYKSSSYLALVLSTDSLTVTTQH